MVSVFLHCHYRYILFSVFLGMLVSHSRTNNFTLFFDRKGWRREKRRHFFLLLFSVHMGNPGVVVGREWLRHWMKWEPPPWQPLLKVLRGSQPPLCHEADPLFKAVTCASVHCELHLGSSEETHHCLWWPACAKTKRLWVCFEEIIAAWWLSALRRTFFLFYDLKNIYAQVINQTIAKF